MRQKHRMVICRWGRLVFRQGRRRDLGQPESTCRTTSSRRSILRGMVAMTLAAWAWSPHRITASATEISSEPFLGVRHIQRVESVPRPLFINVLEIDLEAPGLSFQLTPGGSHPRPTGTNGLPMETVRQTTRAYANTVGAQLAINGSFYSTACSGCSTWANNLGLTASNGEAYSPWELPSSPGFDDALNITQQNQASIVRMPASLPTGFETNPAVALYNTVTGSHRLLSAGSNVAPAPTPGDNLTQLHPRTAAGVTADGKLLLMTVDGRQPGFSEGVTLVELANLLADFGAVDAINLDGGGSTTLAINRFGDTDSYGNPFASRLANSPSEAERSVGTNLAVFAAPNTDYSPPKQVPAPPQGTDVLDNFEANDGRFSGSLWSTPGNYGVSSSSNTRRVTNESGLGQASQRLVVKSSQPSTPGLELTHLSGGGTPGNNPSLLPQGYLGFYLKVHPTGVETGDLRASVVVDDGAESERGVPQTIIADGGWHLYQWDLGNSDSWEGASGGNGQIDAGQVTLHGLTFTADSNLDFTLFVDMVAHNPSGPLAPPRPPGDYNGDTEVDAADYQLWKSTYGQSVTSGSGADGNSDGVIDLVDYTVWRNHLADASVEATLSNIPEPACLSGAFILLLGFGWRSARQLPTSHP